MKRFSTNPIVRDAPGAFTLIELLVVVVVLGILAVLAVPQFSTAAEDSAYTCTLRQTQMLRAQIELFRNQENRDPDLLGSQWADLVDNDYLANEPYNLLNRSSVIGGAPGPGVGWVWRDKGNGTFLLYPTDMSSLAELVE